MNNQKQLSATCICRLRAQGYQTQTDAELSRLAFGIRFAYLCCATLLTIGVIKGSISLLSILFIIAFSSIFLANHPFDYIYNNLLAGIIGKPKLPRRPKQLKFACGIATVWIGLTIYFFSIGFVTAGEIMGGLLSSVAFLVGTTDYCIPSVIYNTLFEEEQSTVCTESK